MPNDPNDLKEQKSEKIQNTANLVITVFLALVLIFVLAVITYIVIKNNRENPGTKNTTKTQKEGVAVSPLDGTTVSASKADRHPLAIMVENHPDARPQVGLDKASIVYEAITEGGITRFMAIFGPNDASKVGPVRSARTYFVDWAEELNAFLSHVGGNLDALDKIKLDNVYDLDEFGIGDAAYWRENSAFKDLEHTMYTSTDLLYFQASKKGWPVESSSFKAYKFQKPEENNSENTLAQNITIDFSTASYLVGWNFDPKTNKYLRSMAGSPHKDQATTQQLSANNLIIQSVARTLAPTSIGEEGYAMQTIGSGKAIIFINGKEINGTWKKGGIGSRTLFYDENGKEIEFIPGNFWIEIVPPDVFNLVKIK